MGTRTRKKVISDYQPPSDPIELKILNAVQTLVRPSNELRDGYSDLTNLASDDWKKAVERWKAATAVSGENASLKKDAGNIIANSRIFKPITDAFVQAMKHKSPLEKSLQNHYLSASAAVDRAEDAGETAYWSAERTKKAHQYARDLYAVWRSSDQAVNLRP